MYNSQNVKRTIARRHLSGGTAVVLLQFVLGTKVSAADASASQFDFLSKNGNSNCTKAFLDSNPTMPENARLQNSCCGPIEFTRYKQQIIGPVKYKAFADIPADPYDIEAGQATKLLSYYDWALTADKQKEYDYAMEHSHEKDHAAVVVGDGRSIVGWQNG